MRNKIVLAVLTCLCFSLMAIAQPQMPHASAETRQRARDRADYNTFRRKIGELKEFNEERKKIPALKKGSKDVVKVYATIDSVETDDTSKMKTLTGYITQQVGDNVANAYEITFDRTAKRITSVKKTGEGLEPEGAEEKVKPAPKKGEVAKPVVKKKKKDGDEEDDEPEEKDEKPNPKEKDE